MPNSIPTIAAVCIAFFFVATAAPAQVQPSPAAAPQAVNKFTPLRIQSYQLKSSLMGREMPYKIIFPAGYRNDGNGNRRYAVLYLLHGLFGHFDNWTDKTKIVDYSEPYNLIIVTPEGGDGWYTDSATVANDKYESYIIQELIPEIDKKFRTVADRKNRIIAGLSMGGYGAIKFGLKYPDKFSLVGSFSGALDAPLRGQDNKNLRPSIVSVFGPDGSKTRTDNDIYRMVREASAETMKSLPYVYFACGTEDFLFQPNREFDTLLLEKKVPHEYRELPGAHTWDFWDAQVQEFLRVAGRRLNSK